MTVEDSDLFVPLLFQLRLVGHASLLQPCADKLRHFTMEFINLSEDLGSWLLHPPYQFWGSILSELYLEPHEIPQRIILTSNDFEVPGGLLNFGDIIGCVDGGGNLRKFLKAIKMCWDFERFR